MIDIATAVDGGIAERLRDRHGAAAQDWVDRLPELVGELCARWSLRTVGLLAGGTSVVLHCLRADGSGAVLKIVPDTEIARSEAVALRAWAARRGVVDLLDADLAAGALLLAAIEPGVALSGRPGPLPWDDVLALLRDLPAPVPPDVALPSLAERVDAGFRLWARRRVRLDGGPAASALLDAATVARSHAYALDLARTWRGPDLLLHGDLHPGNVLDGGRGRGLVAIDPRPCLGDPDFDGIDWVHAGLDDPGRLPDRARWLAARVPRFDAERLTAWATATAVMPAVAHLLAGHTERARPLIALARSVP